MAGITEPFTDPKSALSIPVGIVIGLLASFVQSLGLTIQRKSHVVDQSLPEHRRRVEHRRPLWLLGFAIFLSSNLIGSLVQIASLPVVILAPLGAVSLLWNAFFARLILGDRFSPWMILGTILIAGGAILIAVFGIVPEPTRSLEDLLELFRRPAFAAYFSSLAFVVVVCLAITHITEFALARRVAALAPEECDDADSVVLASPTSNIIDLSQTSTLALDSDRTLDAGDRHTNDDINGATERTPLLFDHKSRSSSNDASDTPKPPEANLKSLDRTRILVAISYASFSGILSGMCLIFAKSGVELLLLTLAGNNQFGRWETWVLLLGLVVFALLQLWYLHKALILADPTLVCPSAFCFYNLSSIVNGLVYFNQLSLIRPLHLCLVVLGIVVLLGGVWVVSIQSGGGGVDVSPWGEDAELVNPEGVIYDEPVSAHQLEGGPIPGAEGEEEEVQEIPVSRSRSRRSVRIGPVPMDRETRSDSSALPAVSQQHPERRDTSESGRSRRRNSSLSGSASVRPRLGDSAHSTLPISPMYHTRYSLKHRLSLASQTLDHQHHHQGHLSRVASYSSHSIAGAPSESLRASTSGPLSPPAAPFGGAGGLQIGLSPVSPGFSIMPRARKPRLAGLGRAGDTGGSSAVERRRTVSEGDVNRLLREGYGARSDEEDGEEEEGFVRGRGDLGHIQVERDGRREQDDEHGRAEGGGALGWLRRLVWRGKSDSG